MKQRVKHFKLILRFFLKIDLEIVSVHAIALLITEVADSIIEIKP